MIQIYPPVRDSETTANTLWENHRTPSVLWYVLVPYLVRAHFTDNSFVRDRLLLKLQRYQEKFEYKLLSMVKSVKMAPQPT